MKETTIIQLELCDLRQILKEAQAEAMKEVKDVMYDKFSHVGFSYTEVSRLHNTCYRTLNDMVKAGIITPDEKGKFNAAEVLKWDFQAMKKKMRYLYKVA